LLTFSLLMVLLSLSMAAYATVVIVRMVDQLGSLFLAGGLYLLAVVVAALSVRPLRRLFGPLGLLAEERSRRIATF
jgi:hypothetical protein